MKIFCLVLLLTSIQVYGQENLKTHQLSGAVDLQAPFYLDKGQSKNNYFDVHSAEVSLFGPIDQTFEGLLNIAGHSDEGEFEFEIHEAYIGSSKLIPRSRFRVGKFFLGVGRLNQFHQHDWPFTSAPKVQREFFNEEGEGVNDTGIEYTYLMPTARFIELTVGVTNGYCYGHCHERGNKPPYPLHYVRPSTFIELSSQEGILLGLNYLGRSQSEGSKTSLFGFDATYKNRTGKLMRWLVQGEFWYELNDQKSAEDTKKMGYYVYPQYGLDENWSLGVRVDGFTDWSQRLDDGSHQKNFDYGFVPTLTYKPSEFSTFRLSYSHLIETDQGESNQDEKIVQLQFVYLLGAHPSHDF